MSRSCQIPRKTITPAALAAGPDPEARRQSRTSTAIAAASKRAFANWTPASPPQANSR
ncbi:MAG TPA: hypothetical protein VFC78_21180 [Tepidisphaeraceae bacterium]|nr:hypothetical protein [Tepidisphaeraceae bacterium]